MSLETQLFQHSLKGFPLFFSKPNNQKSTRVFPNLIRYLAFWVVVSASSIATETTKLLFRDYCMEVFTVPATVENPVFSPINDVIITQLDKISLSCGVEILTDMWDNADNILILRSAKVLD